MDGSRRVLKRHPRLALSQCIQVQQLQSLSHVFSVCPLGTHVRASTVSLALEERWD